MTPEFISLQKLKEMFDLDFVANHKIETIKRVRQITGEGLKEAKDFVEKELFESSDSTNDKYMMKSTIEQMLDDIMVLQSEVHRLKQGESGNNQTKQKLTGLFRE